MLLFKNIPHHAGFFRSCWKVCARKWCPTCLHGSESDGPSVTWVLTAVVIGIKSSAYDKMLKHFLQPISKPLAFPHSSPVCVPASGNFARKQWATSFLFFCFDVYPLVLPFLRGWMPPLSIRKVAKMVYNCKNDGVASTGGRSCVE